MTTTLAAAALLVWIAGAAIGATSIGGVLAVPALAGVAGVPVTAAIAASSFGFLMTGLYGWHARARPQADAAPAAWPLHLAALGGAAAGALLVHHVPSSLVRGWVAVLTIGSGLHALVTARRAAGGAARPWPRAPGLMALGAAVGCGSALSGTGGPVLLLPVLLLLGLPTAASVAVAQAVQLPIALAASATHLAAGRLDLQLALAVGVLLLAGAWAGRQLAGRADPATLRRLTALALIATGAWYGLT